MSRSAQTPKPMPTLLSLFLDRVKRDGPCAALAVKRQGQYHWLSWQELADDVGQMAARLVALGIQRGDRVVLASENRYEWILCDLAVHVLGGIHVAVHCSLSGSQIAYQIRDSGARLAIVSGAEQARKVAAVAAELPPGLQVYSLDPADGIAVAGVPVMPLAEVVVQAGHNPLEHNPQTTADDLATILYTSGTTGEPKGVMLTHGNLVSNALACLETFCHPADELRMCWLPLSHIYARTSDLYVWIASGTQMALAESRDTLLADCAAVHPTFINGVPYFYQKVARYLQDAGRGDEPAHCSVCSAAGSESAVPAAPLCPTTWPSFSSIRG